MRPPSTVMTCPVTNVASSLTSYATNAATSAGEPGMSDWVNAAKGSAKRFRVGLGANELDIEIRIDQPGCNSVAKYAFSAMIDRHSSG